MTDIANNEPGDVTQRDMPPARAYKLGNEFPFESFVQSAIEKHFRDGGFDVDASGRVDLLCVHPATGECWHIEAKGKTTQVGLDFRTCLGQLIQHITSGPVHYAIALPDTPAFAAQGAKVDPWVIEQLSIHWLHVAQDGTVTIDRPRGRVR